MFASANEQGTVTFTGLNGQTGFIFVNFNINFGGVLNAGGDAGDIAQAGFNAQLNGISYGIQNAFFAGNGATGCGSLGSFMCNATSLGHYVTDTV